MLSFKNTIVVFSFFLRAGRATRAGVFPFCIYVAYTRMRAENQEVALEGAGNQ